MPTLVQLVDKYALYLYAICALLLIPFLSELQRARRDRQSIFPLEKENATKRLRRSLLAMVLVAAIAGGIYYIDSYVEPTVVPIDETPTATATVSILFATPTNSPAPPTETPTITPTETRRPRPTPQETAEPTETPTPQVIAPSCPNPDVRITSPGVNAVLNGTVEIRGSASLESFGYYKFEFQSLSVADEWHHVFTGEKPVTDGVLGYWNVDPLPDGVYLFQLVVVDATGNYPPPCQVQVTVQH